MERSLALSRQTSPAVRFDSTRRSNSLLFEKHRLKDSSTGGSHLVNPSIDVEEISKVFLSAFCFRSNMTRGKIRFPFDRGVTIRTDDLRTRAPLSKVRK